MGVKRTKEDNIFSKVIREANNYTCERCGKNVREDKQNCHASHFVGRSDFRLRWDTDNVSCHCGSCHHELGTNPAMHTEWFDTESRLAKGLEFTKASDIVNEKVIEHKKSMRKIKWDRPELHKHYLAELKRIEKLRSEGVTGYIELINYW